MTTVSGWPTVMTPSLRSLPVWKISSSAAASEAAPSATPDTATRPATIILLPPNTCRLSHASRRRASLKSRDLPLHRHPREAEALALHVPDQGGALDVDVDPLLIGEGHGLADLRVEGVGLQVIGVRHGEGEHRAALGVGDEGRGPRCRRRLRRIAEVALAALDRG